MRPNLTGSLLCAAALLLSLATIHAQSTSLQPIAFQFPDPMQGQQQGNMQGKSGSASASNPLLGSWHQMQPGSGGGVNHTFWIYNADGTYAMTSMQDGGPRGANGFRMQFWGKYKIAPAGNGRYQVSMTPVGKAPLQTCAENVGCRSTGPIPPTSHAFYQFQGDQLQSTDGISAQRSQVPPALMQQVPARWVIAAPPPVYSGGGSGSGASSGGSSYNSPKYHVPGQGGTCDDLQVSRVCTINDGTTYRNRETGCLVCTR